MKFTETNVVSSPEIRNRLLDGELTVPVTVVDASFTDGVCKAGTPLTRAGAVPEDNTGAEGILLSDVYEDNPNGALVVAFAAINSTVAAAHSGVTYDDDLKAALPNIVFE